MIKVLKEVSIQEFKDFLYDIDINDLNIYKEANNPNSVGTFQLEGGTASKCLDAIHPENFEELVAINAMARPGTIDFLGEYVENKKTGKSKYHPSVAKLLEQTRYVPLYQEQAMQIFHEIGGFSLEETDQMRGLMKKLGKLEKKKEDLEEWDRVVKKFIKQSQKNDMTKEEAELIADSLLKMSSYSFNRSHAVAYTYVAVMTLYLSYYFRNYFYSRMITYEVGRKEFIIPKINSIRRQGFNIKKANINFSRKNMFPVENNIYFGFEELKNIKSGVDTIIEHRPYSSLIDFIVKARPDARMLDSLIKAGAFDEIDPNTNKLHAIFKEFWARKKSIKLEEKLRLIYSQVEKEIEEKNIETTRDDLIAFEREIYGYNFFTPNISSVVLDKMEKYFLRGIFARTFADVDYAGMFIPLFVSDVQTLKDKNGNLMAFIVGEDSLGETERFPIFSSFWKYVSNDIEKSNLYLIKVFRDDNDKILFGQSKRTFNEKEIRDFIRRIKNDT